MIGLTRLKHRVVNVRRDPPKTRTPAGTGVRRHPVLRRSFELFGMLMLVTGVAGAVLLSLTPPASDAVALVRAQARAHGAAYPPPQPPVRFTESLVATEDRHFYSPLDPGIDPYAVARVIVGKIMGWSDQGGSTLEQQLAKMLYTPGRRRVMAKLEQVALAVQLRFSYTKREILAMYAEVVYFGDGDYGLRSASCGYFGKNPTALSWAQAAMLAGILNAPSIDNPRVNLPRAEARERHVLARLVAVGDLTKAQATIAQSQPLGLAARSKTDHLSCT